MRKRSSHKNNRRCYDRPRPDDDDAFPPPPKSIRRGTNKASSEQPEQAGRQAGRQGVLRVLRYEARGERERESGTIPIPPPCRP